MVHSVAVITNDWENVVPVDHNKQQQTTKKQTPQQLKRPIHGTEKGLVVEPALFIPVFVVSPPLAWACF
jgi:hypothetical protein